MALATVRCMPLLALAGLLSPLTSAAEIDVMEGFGDSEFHVEYGPPGTAPGSGASNPGSTGGITGGTHTYGVLWSTTGVVLVNDGVIVGSEVAPITGPADGELTRRLRRDPCDAYHALHPGCGTDRGGWHPTTLDSPSRIVFGAM